MKIVITTNKAEKTAINTVLTTLDAKISDIKTKETRKMGSYEITHENEDTTVSIELNTGFVTEALAFMNDIAGSAKSFAYGLMGMIKVHVDKLKKWTEEEFNSEAAHEDRKQSLYRFNEQKPYDPGVYLAVFDSNTHHDLHKIIRIGNDMEVYTEVFKIMEGYDAVEENDKIDVFTIVVAKNGKVMVYNGYRPALDKGYYPFLIEEANDDAIIAKLKDKAMNLIRHDYANFFMFADPDHDLISRPVLMSNYTEVDANQIRNELTNYEVVTERFIVFVSDDNGVYCSGPINENIAVYTIMKRVNDLLNKKNESETVNE